MEEIYFGINIDALKDFRNVFSNQFLRDNKGKLTAYTHARVESNVYATNIRPIKDIIVAYDYDPMVKNSGLVFRFSGNGYVYITKTGKDENNILACACKCEPNINSRDHISDMIYEKFGVTIIL